MLVARLQMQEPIPLDLEFRVSPGEILALVGPSGAGKSTVLRCIAGLWRRVKGSVVVDGEVWLDTTGFSLPVHQRRVGYVFQSYALFPHMSAAGNVRAALGHLPADQRDAAAGQLLARVGLEGMESRHPGQLSGGQQQRVAIARALARDPAVLLLDEPFSAVDRAARQGLYRQIRTLRDTLGIPVILVTHDLDEARLLSDRLLIIDNGREISEGPTVELMGDPDALRTLGVRETSTLITATVVEHEADGLCRLTFSAGSLFLPGVDQAPGTRLQIRIMAHEVMLSQSYPLGLSALNVFPASVRGIREGEGPAVIVELQVGDDRLLSRITRRSATALSLQPGTLCHVVLKSMAVARGHLGSL